MTYAVIMAGGRGERFWPKSRQKYPKQFLPLISNKTMLQITVGRVKKFIAPDKIFIITADNYQEIVYQQIPDVPRENIILEPVSYTHLDVYKRQQPFPEVVAPGDHLIPLNHHSTYRHLQFGSGLVGLLSLIHI